MSNTIIIFANNKRTSNINRTFFLMNILLEGENLLVYVYSQLLPLFVECLSRLPSKRRRLVTGGSDSVPLIVTPIHRDIEIPIIKGM